MRRRKPSVPNKARAQLVSLRCNRDEWQSLKWRQAPLGWLWRSNLSEPFSCRPLLRPTLLATSCDLQVLDIQPEMCSKIKETKYDVFVGVWCCKRPYNLAGREKTYRQVRSKNAARRRCKKASVFKRNSQRITMGHAIVDYLFHDDPRWHVDSFHNVYGLLFF